MLTVIPTCIPITSIGFKTRSQDFKQPGEYHRVEYSTFPSRGAVSIRGRLELEISCTAGALSGVMHAYVKPN